MNHKVYFYVTFIKDTAVLKQQALSSVLQEIYIQKLLDKERKILILIFLQKSFGKILVKLINPQQKYHPLQKLQVYPKKL